MRQLYRRRATHVQKNASLESYGSPRGFTIIEVLIVLAIAGLIIIVIFLAVPALQRNSRNTQYRNEASRLMAATHEFVTVSGNTLPSSAADATVIRGNANVTNNTTLNVVNPGTTTAVTPTLTTATLEVGVVCGASGGTSITPTTTNAPPKVYILIYGVEKNDGTVVAQCLRS